MSNKLYVSNLPYQIAEEELKGEFADHGTVRSVKIITDYDTGRSKGFGFVEMETAEEAQDCIDNLNGKKIVGREMRVSIARERTNNRPNGGNGGANRRRF